MTELAAIPAGTVFMGAHNFVGRAPDFMVYAIACHAGERMPGFFGSTLWSGVVLVLIFVLPSLYFFG